ncbi:uncharacterized protein LOC121387985 [Gigantopelta aegis]|uniref:uncharacterized protein LOC121387985 n=1 Tax=Gigantopelta aegis TaxID=1735272 RepID=UPI001B88CB19|nr:uncharacterized protein LOC121387985 [Gigantopelta aegis]XP_041375106.1 uncharacterized protein LOC121387985 [Gigantopelta aegis]
MAGLYQLASRFYCDYEAYLIGYKPSCDSFEGRASNPDSMKYMVKFQVKQEDLGVWWCAPDEKTKHTNTFTLKLHSLKFTISGTCPIGVLRFEYTMVCTVDGASGVGFDVLFYRRGLEMAKFSHVSYGSYCVVIFSRYEYTPSCGAAHRTDSKPDRVQYLLKFLVKKEDVGDWWCAQSQHKKPTNTFTLKLHIGGKAEAASSARRSSTCVALTILLPIACQLINGVAFKR